MSGIYIHIPFCKQACNYCDFYFSTNLKLKTELIDALKNEILLRNDYLKERNLESIYLGGGTPSLLNSVELLSIIELIKKHYLILKDCEITLEANPDDINHESLKSWLNIGINRLSIGLQSFNNEELKWMNRAHTAQESIECVKMAQEAGFGNISIDLIYGSKFQDLNSWQNTLQTAIALKPKHISAYNLTIEGKTKLNNQLIKGIEPPVNDQLSGLQFQTMIDHFSQFGFEQYEISNFAQNGFTAVHNTNYWFQKPYLGIGPSAHSYDGKSRQWNLKNNQLYIKNVNQNVNYFELENLSQKDLYNEFILTRLRTKWGINEEEIKTKFDSEMYQTFKKNCLLNQNYLNFQNGVFTLNEEGKLLADKIASDLFIL